MKVKSLMTKDPVVIELPATRSYALELFKKHKVRSFPVVRRHTGEVVGIISIKRVLLHPDEDQLAMLVKRDVPLVKPNDDVKKAAKLMINNHYRRVVVINDENKVVGILTVGDVIRRYLSKNEKMRDIEIADFYQKYTSVIWRGTPLKAALRALLLADTMALPVLDDEGKLIGIIDETDILKDSEVVRTVKSSELVASSEEKVRDYSLWHRSHPLHRTNQAAGKRTDSAVRWSAAILQRTRYPPPCPSLPAWCTADCGG